MELYHTVFEFNIGDFKLHHSKPFVFKNKRELNRYTDHLITNHEPYIYRRFEAERNHETLQIIISWSILVFVSAFLLIITAFFFVALPLIAFILSGTSLISFITGIFLKKGYEQLARNVDFTKSLITDELISQIKEDMKSSIEKEDNN